ncbi:MAG: CBS domain-containing protein [Chitinophagales bacterium]|jgi:CBS domain-containing protein|nr:CBS domain-containing protein [Chitinophagaceae bacterium]MBP9884571.1 CBS domain-containing protein [Chitinophagales bacterium]
MNVNDILRRKSNQIFSIPPTASVYDALTLMSEKNLGGVLVMNGDQLAGIFTERDYARKIILLGRSSKDTPITEVMTSSVRTISRDTEIDDCMKMMTEKTIRHLPVVENGKVVGLVSIGDVVKLLIEEQKGIIDHLQSYIAGQ